MPHDIDGKLIQVGDRVFMEFVVRSVSTAEEYCNLQLESMLPLYPGTSTTSLSAVNARQVRKIQE